MKEHGFKPEDIVRVSARGPGDFMNEFRPDKYGRIEEGYAGSLTIIAPDSPETIWSDNLKTKCKLSPFEGREFPGHVAMTIVQGKVYKHETVLT